MRMMIAVVLLVMALTAVLPAQSYRLWLASVAGSELGHYTALVSLLLILVPGWWRTQRGKWSTVLAGVAFCCSVSPVVRASGVARGLEERVQAAFPQPSLRIASVPDTGATPQLTKPLSVSALYRWPARSGAQLTTVTFAERGGKPLQLDIYRRSGDTATRKFGGAPLAVVIHGGSWTGGTRKDLPELNYFLASRHYVVAAVSYRFAPRFPFPAQTEDVNAAIDYLKANSSTLGIDPDRIAIIGRSAGGQLALKSAYTKHDPSIRGVVAFYPPTDQQWGWDNPADPRVYNSAATLKAFLGGDPSAVGEAYEASSAINFVDSSTVPTLLIHGSMDPLVSVRQSARLDSALAARSRPHLFIELPWATHGCDYFYNGPCAQLAAFAIERFLVSVLR